MKYKYFHAPFFNHFIQCNPTTITKLKSLHGVLKAQLSHKNGSIPLWLASPFDSFKIPPNLYALPSPIIMTTMKRQNNEFSPTARSPRQT